MPLVFSISLIVFATLGHGYLWTDVVNRLHAWSGPRKLIDQLSLGCFLAFLILPAVILIRWDTLGIFKSGQAKLPTGLLQYYLLLCGGWGFAALMRNAIYNFVTDSPRVLTSWQQEPIKTEWQPPDDLFKAGLPRLLSKVPFNQILRPTIDRKRLAIPHLDNRLAGLKIAHISDLHMTGRIGLSWYEQITEQVNKLDADVIVITGDIVESERCWPWLASTLGRLKAPLGVYYVLGNHDFYIDTGHTTKLLQQQGLVSLSERWISTHWNGAAVELAGNELPWATCAADLSDLPENAEQQQPFRLAMLHSPDQFSWAYDHHANLALAGHTHGGQLRFPILGPIISPSRFGTRFACGVFKRGDTVMHVSRGIAGKTPLRWNCPPEIALLELESA